MNKPLKFVELSDEDKLSVLIHGVKYVPEFALILLRDYNITTLEHFKTDYGITDSILNKWIGDTDKQGFNSAYSLYISHEKRKLYNELSVADNSKQVSSIMVKMKLSGLDGKGLTSDFNDNKKRVASISGLSDDEVLSVQYT